MDIEPLEPLPEDWQRALCVVAHPDDMEFGAAAAVARWTGQGKDVVYCMVTSGEAGIDGMAPDECRGSARPSRSSRPGSSASTTSSSSACPTASSSTASRCARAIAEVVRRHRPEIVVTGNFRDTWGGRNLNQADHIAVGRAVVDAVRDAGNRWVFPEQLGDGSSRGAGWGGVGLRLAAGRRTRSTRPTPSTPAWPRWRRTGPTSTGWAGRTSTRASSSRASAGRPGQRLGVGLAAPFEVFPMGWGE